MLEELQLELNEILKGNQNYKSEDQISAMKNLTKLYKGWGKVVKFYNDYTRMILEYKNGIWKLNTNQSKEKS